MVDIRQKAALEMFRVQRSVYVQVERCGDRIQSLPSGEAMTQQALRRLAEQLAKPMIPTAISVSLPLADDPKIPSLRQGIYWAQKQKWYRARKIWKKIAKQDPRCSHAWYNLGVLSEIKGQLALAQQLYTKAEQLDSKDLYVRAVERILARIDLLKASRKRHRIPKK